MTRASVAETIPALFVKQAKGLGRKPLFWVKQAGCYQRISWEQTLDTVQALSAFLLQIQIKPGDRVGILSENRPEWGISDLAIQSIGAWTVPFYPSLTEREILQIATDCEPAACIASSAEQAQKLRAISGKAHSIRVLIVIDAIKLEQPAEQSWAEAIKQGSKLKDRFRGLMEQRMQQLKAHDTATIIYTSGTTGEPKGVMLSHNNFLSNAGACVKAIPIRSSDLHLSFLPLSHIFERMAGWYLMLMVGASVAYAENMDTIAQNMLEVRPTIMLGVPRFFEKLYARVQEALAQVPPHKRHVICWALSVGRRAGQMRLERKPLRGRIWLYELVAKLLVFRRLRRRFGGKLRFFVSGGAPLAKSIGEFFHSVGVVILEGYGLTETSPVISANRLNAIRFGTVGLPVEGVEVRIAEDGEILTRGSHVMQGYYRKPSETQATIIDGWLHTGDIGRFDEEGFLLIADRKKDLIKTAGGKFVAPQKLENLFVTDPYIAQAFVYGDTERYCVALIVPNMERLRGYAKDQAIAHASTHELIRLPVIREFIWRRVQALQKDLASFEQVKAIALLDQEFTQASGELTPTLKARRAAIALRYQDALRQLYLSDPPPASRAGGPAQAGGSVS